MRKIINGISDWSGKITGYLLWVGAFMLTLEVVARYVFNSPTVWAHGYSQRIFGTYFIMVGAYTLLNDGHVRIDVIINRMSEKSRKILDLFNMGFLMLWSSVLIIEGWAFFMDSYKLREVDEMVLAHPVYPYKFMLVFGSVLIFLQAVSTVLKTIEDLINQR